MPTLESVCGEYLMKKITSQNVIRIAKLAKRSYLTDLKENVLKFIQNNPNGFFEEISEELPKM